MAVYDLLAGHYDAVTGDPATEVAFIDSTIKHAHSQAATLLEVACGTGGIIASLTGRYQVSGLDISKAMLAIARKKLPEGTPLHLADMRCFKLDMRFDVIVCAYHGINHLLRFPAWETFFDCVHKHLNDGGLFVFDTFTISNLMVVAAIPKIVQQFGENYVVMRVRTNDQIVFHWNIEVFELQRSGRYKLLSEVIQTATFPLERIRKALRKRFPDIETIESDGGAVGEDSARRTWFVCAKS
jgi:SAM-dependent methyltransferase